MLFPNPGRVLRCEPVREEPTAQQLQPPCYTHGSPAHLYILRAHAPLIGGNLRIRPLVYLQRPTLNRSGGPASIHRRLLLPFDDLIAIHSRGFCRYGHRMTKISADLVQFIAQHLYTVCSALKLLQ